MGRKSTFVLDILSFIVTLELLAVFLYSGHLIFKLILQLWFADVVQRLGHYPFEVNTRVRFPASVQNSYVVFMCSICPSRSMCEGYLRLNNKLKIMAKRRPRFQLRRFGRDLVASSTYGARTERRVHLEMLGALAKSINSGKDLPK